VLQFVISVANTKCKKQCSEVVISSNLGLGRVLTTIVCLAMVGGQMTSLSCGDMIINLFFGGETSPDSEIIIVFAKRP
jgi:hypothetical protein